MNNTFKLFMLSGMTCMFSLQEVSALTGTAGPTEGNVISIIENSPKIRYNNMIFGQFIEHFHTQIYGGIYDPSSRFADEDGFRTDVIDALKEIKCPIVRWPGGCFVSTYHWLDGVGAERTPVYDKSWQVEDPNTFGTDEYIKWCRKVGTEPYICTNAGTGTPEEMSDWVEYCNLSIGKYGRMRMANGHKEPYGVKYWSVGNENYGDGNTIGIGQPKHTDARRYPDKQCGRHTLRVCHRQQTPLRRPDPAPRLQRPQEKER